MSADGTRTDAQLEEAERLARLLASVPEDGEDVDPNDLALLVGGSPSESERATLLAHLDTEAASVAGALGAVVHGAGHGAIEKRSTGRRWLPMAAAALVLAGVGVWLALRAGPQQPIVFDDAALVAAFEDLGQHDGQTFEGLAPLLHEERLEGTSLVRRGGMQVTSPSGTVLTDRPELSWEDVPGVETYHIDVLSVEGDEVLKRRIKSPSLPWPTKQAALKHGMTYVLTVRGRAGGISFDGSRAFTVAADTTRTRYASALQAIDQRVAAELRPVARAHVAIRLKLLREAATFLQADMPESVNELAQETRDHLARLTGN